MRTFILFSLLFFPLCLTAQKSLRKSLVNPRASWVHIDTENCFELTVSNSETKEVIVEARIDGEYSEDLVIAMEEEGNMITVRPGFRPDFEHPNDKLSAHKVISIALEVRVPEYTNVKVYGNHTHVKANGIFSQVEVSLDDGQCDMNLEAETLHVRTQSGDIFFESKGARVEAESRYGRVAGDRIPKGNGLVELVSTSGNIYLKRGD